MSDKNLENLFNDIYDDGGLKALEMFEQYHRWWRRPSKTIHKVRMGIVSSKLERAINKVTR